MRLPPLIPDRCDRLPSGNRRVLEAAGPRRFSICVRTKPPGAGSSAMRNGDADASFAADAERIANANASVAPTKPCRRRIPSGRARGNHATSAPSAFDRKIVSHAHCASAGDSVFTQRTCLANPMRASSGPFGANGHPTNQIGRLRCTAASRAPRSIDSSPMPGCLTINSETDPSAQPPPGNSASNAWMPLAMTRPTGRASWLALHSDG